jgi:hypothetical protein
MRKTVGLLTFAVLLLAGPAVFGQATRTWVSGVGDDANPCSRTAPCKTFAGAISKTAAGGEISVLDPGGYGALNITKSITLNGAGTLASILFSGTNGIIVNGAGIIVNIKDISLNGGSPTSPGVNGIRIIQAARVNVENCDIFNFSNVGILDERTTAGITVVRNTRITNSIAFGGNTTTMGIRLLPSSGVAANLLACYSCTISGHTLANSFGVHVSQGGKAFLNDSLITGNTRGVTAVSTTGTGEITITDSDLSGNVIGARAAANGTVRLSGTTISSCSTNGLEFAGGTIASFGNNSIAGNVGNNGAGLTGIAIQ